MNILVIGTDGNLQECEKKFGSNHQYSCVSNRSEVAETEPFHLIMDFFPDKGDLQVPVYLNTTTPIFFNAVKRSLTALLTDKRLRERGNIFGFNGLPGFLSHTSMEVCVCHTDDKQALAEVLTPLNVDFVLVEDRIGMVSARIICMIINEAYFTVQEKTASREDIDLAMKLGTNYPHGPFEWSHRIGLIELYELLDALYQDTKDERYKISPLLKREYHRALMI